MKTMVTSFVFAAALATFNGAQADVGQKTSLALTRSIQSLCRAAPAETFDLTASPVGHLVAFVRATHDRTDPSSLWLFKPTNPSCKMLVHSHPTDNNTTNLRGLNNPVFSVDGKAIYVLSQAWVTSDTLFRVDLATGKRQFVSAANLVMVIRDGPYRNDLIISEHAYNAGPEGGSFERLLLISPAGRRLMVLPKPNDGEDAGPWLHQHHWHVLNSGGVR
ncbi:hypothetical protein [Novosphingobium sp.]|uniref:hypothetical protein n=1 Tax=Novosphingobium sp. TaxID=1874826 RepID=UPI0025CD5828|nr:hypothetical protein [Novosphingobium sp.]